MKKKEEIIAENEALETTEAVTPEIESKDGHDFVVFEKANEELRENAEAVSEENVKIFSFDTIRTALILLLVTGFTVLLLAFVNYFTAGPIAAHRKAELDRSVAQMFPDTEYTQITGISLPEGVSEIYLIHTNQDKPCGFLVIAKPMGFGGEMELMVGMDLEGKVNGVKMISDQETATKVAPLKEDGFLDKQYTDKKAPFKFTKDGGTVEAVSGSTVSSEAVLTGVNNACGAVDAYLDYLRKEQAK